MIESQGSLNRDELVPELEKPSDPYDSQRRIDDSWRNSPAFCNVPLFAVETGRTGLSAAETSHTGPPY